MGQGSTVEDMRTYAHQHMIKNGGFISSVGSMNAMISSTLKPHTNAHTVCGTYTILLEL